MKSIIYFLILITSGHAFAMDINCLSQYERDKAVLGEKEAMRLRMVRNAEKYPILSASQLKALETEKGRKALLVKERLKGLQKK